MKVTILVTGRALCRRPNADGRKKLEALFFHADNDHKLTMEVTKIISPTNKLTGVFRIPRQTKISLEMADTSPLTAPTDPKYNISNINNINHLHNSTVRLKHFPGGGANDPKTSYLSLEDANWYTFSQSDQTFELWRHNISGNVKNHIETKQVGREIAADFDVQATGHVNVRLTGPFPTFFTFPWESNVSYEIAFANDCPDRDCGDDFFIFYRIIDGTAIQIEQFIHPSRDKETACNPVIGGDDFCNFETYFSSGGASC